LNSIRFRKADFLCYGFSIRIFGACLKRATLAGETGKNDDGIHQTKTEQPQTRLMESTRKSKPYSVTCQQNIFHKYTERVIKNHNFTFHSLQHGYATHLLDRMVCATHA